MPDNQTQSTDPQSPPPAPEPEVVVDPTKIHVMVRNRKQVLIEEDVKAISSKNDTGVFDVLPEHSNFISIIKESITIHKLDGQQVKIPVVNGVMKVKNSTIRCFIDLLSPDEAAQKQIPVTVPEKTVTTPQDSH